MKKILVLCIALLFMLISSSSHHMAMSADSPRIQIAILLDTSNSMDGLMNQAKSRLWSIVNEMAMARKQNTVPRLEVALFEYGNDSLSAESNFVRRVTPLTSDLDAISQALFGLTTNGGSEYCGAVIQEAVDRLEWSNVKNDLQLIFIAGNEPFSQGPVDYRQSCKSAISRGITVNTIFCGDLQNGINTMWNEGALLADGSYSNIDQDRQLVHISAPQDKKILALGKKLNETYIPFGIEGIKRKAMQKKQDEEAGAIHEEVAVQRSVAKSSSYYTNTGWDLVDAVDNGNAKLSEIPAEKLPANMKKMSAKERELYVLKMKKKRIVLQEKINTLNRERSEYIAAKNSEQSDENTLNNALLKVLREQAQKKHFTFTK
ncbi:MAG: vWA domain-containing protein [Spirochaetota bacterium]